MSLEGISEPHFWAIIRRLLDGYCILPPGTIRAVDAAISREIVFLEVEDTLFELYNAIKQLITIAKLSYIYDAGFLAIAPAPSQLLDAPVIISYYFWKIHEEIGSGQRELWLVSYKRDLRVPRMKLSSDKWIDWLKPRAHIIKTEIPISDRNELKKYIRAEIIPIIREILA